MMWTQRLTSFFATSLQRKLMLVITIFVSLVMITFGFYLINTQRQTASAELEGRAVRTANLLSQSTALLLWNVDKEGINAQLSAVMADPEVNTVSIYETDASEPLVTTNRGESTAVDPITSKADIIFQNGDDKVLLGTVQVVYSRELLNRSLNRTQIVISIIILALISLLVISIYFLIGRLVINPLNEMTTLTGHIAAGDLSGRVNLTSHDEMSILASSLNSMATQLRDLIGSLEQRVVDRTKALAAVAEISTAASTILETDKLLQQVVNFSKERFNFYHAHIYLLNEAGDTLVLASGAGEPGRQMMAKGLSIPLDREQSLVARAARERKGITVNDVTQAPDFLPNPLLPDTRSELAVPMIIGENVIGVFDVQSDTVGHFTEADVNIQTTLASQIASAVQNARLYAQADTSRQEAQSLVDYASEAILAVDLGTGNFTEPNESAEKLYGLPREELVKVGPAQMSPPKQPDGRDSTEKAMEKIGDAMQGKSPIFEWMHRNAQGQDILCEIRLVRLPGTHPRVRATVTDITERRRIEELTRQRAQQQEALNLITQKIQNATTVEAALQIAARELGHALGMKTTRVALDSEAGISEQKVIARE